MTDLTLQEVATEILADADIEIITGLVYPAAQIKWLKKHGWNFEINRKNKPVVGKYYARMRLAGVKVTQDEPSRTHADLDKVS